MKHILTTLILILNFSCSSQLVTPELKNNFSEAQIEDLSKIREFFKDQICDNKNSDFNTCFLKILPELLEYGLHPILEKIDFEKQKELYNSLSPSTFDEIWEFGRITYPDTGLELKSIGLKHNGKYQKYLIELGKNNTEIEKYVNQLISTGDFESMGRLQQCIYKNPAELNPDNPNI